jgi:hypothetical protein
LPLILLLIKDIKVWLFSTYFNHLCCFRKLNPKKKRKMKK